MTLWYGLQVSQLFITLLPAVIGLLVLVGFIGAAFIDNKPVMRVMWSLVALIVIGWLGVTTVSMIAFDHDEQAIRERHL